jgi:hypothetical protein
MKFTVLIVEQEKMCCKIILGAVEKKNRRFHEERESVRCMNPNKSIVFVVYQQT